MGRPAKFDEDQVLDAALRVVAERGPGAATIGAIAAELGAPVGSIYHRFRSRDLLLARLWMRTVRRAQDGFVTASDPVEAALHVTQWCRDHLDEARVLLLYRRQDLAARWPQELGAELATLNDRVAAALADLARRRFGRADADTLRRLTFAIVDVPYAAVRRHLLADEPPPPEMDDLVRAACLAVLRDDGRAREKTD